VLLVGSGIRRAGGGNALLEWLKQWPIPVVTSANGKDLVPQSHPGLMGLMGAWGNRSANFAIQNCDLLISIGSRLSVHGIGCDQELFAREAYKIVVDIDSAELDKPTLHPDLAVQADAKDVLLKLSEKLGKMGLENKQTWAPWLARTQAWRAHYLADALPPEGNQVEAYRLVQALSQKAKAGQTLVLDRGLSLYVTLQGWEVKERQRILSCSGLLSSGFALPAAIGAAYANSNGPILCICGDGGLMLQAAELATMAHYKLPIKLFVLDNGGDATVRKTQQAYLSGRLVGSDAASGLALPNLEKMSAGFGLKVQRIEKNAQLEGKLTSILASPGPAVVVVSIDPAQQPQPRLVSDQRPDGTVISKPLEDMYPFLSREELRRNMIIPIMEE
jgi:acetolactate synthase-1/2/3 large subunit